MKNLISIFIAVLFSIVSFAQSPQKMSYQAIIRNSNNILITNSPVGMKISILKDLVTGTAVYIETQTPTSNINGLVSIEIGNGNVITGSFSTIDWSTGLYFLKTETDPAGGTNYTITGTSQLLSVPYALYAKSAGSVFNNGLNVISDRIFVSTPLSPTLISNTQNLNLKNSRIWINNMFSLADSLGTFSGNHLNMWIDNTSEKAFISSRGTPSTFPLILQYTQQGSIAGNVGIGHNSPSERLQVDGNISLTSRGQKIYFPGAVNDTTTCYITRPVGTDGLLMYADDIYIKSFTTPMQLQSVSGINMMDMSGNIKMNVNTQTGNVGIGTTTPARTLHINSVMRLEPIPSAPLNPAKGDIYFDSSLNKLRAYDGTTWQNCW